MAKVMKELVKIATGLTIEMTVFMVATLALPIFMGLYSGACILKITGNGYIAIPVAIASGMLAMINGIQWWMDDWSIYYSPLFNMNKEE